MDDELDHSLWAMSWSTPDGGHSSFSLAITIPLNLQLLKVLTSRN